MTTKEHKKHSDITRPLYGAFCRNEWAMVGTACNVITSLASEIIKALSPQYKCAYADSKHPVEDAEILFPGCLVNGAVAEYTNHINYHQLNYVKGFNEFQFRQQFNDADIVLVNGNHFEAKSQILVIDEIKKESLKKKLFQLTNVELILLTDSAVEVFDFIKEAVSLWDKIPVYKLSETHKIIGFFKTKLEKSKPLLNGLVLAGGKSVRMGYDKGSIAWHGKEQQYYLADLLKTLCNDVYISCRLDQQEKVDSNYQTLTDTFTGLGPYGAILSAFRERPDAAWLVIACDLPLLDIDTLQYLKDHRNPSSIATTFESPYNSLPEPLITIWEPKSYPVLLSFLSQGYSCPGKVLRNNDPSILKALNPTALTNVNTQDELQKVQQELQKKLQANHAT
ncbi:MAG: NTP transferase domain-containing protein [Ginsengibacter sp.]